MPSASVSSSCWAHAGAGADLDGEGLTRVNDMHCSIGPAQGGVGASSHCDMKWASAVKSAPVKSDDCTMGAKWAGSKTPPTGTGALESDGVGSPRQSKGASPARSGGGGSVGSSGCHASRVTGADRSATRLHGMGWYLAHPPEGVACCHQL